MTDEKPTIIPDSYPALESETLRSIEAPEERPTEVPEPMAQVFGGAWVSGEAQVYSKISNPDYVCGQAQVFGKATVCGDAEIFDDVLAPGTWTATVADAQRRERTQRMRQQSEGAEFAMRLMARQIAKDLKEQGFIYQGLGRWVHIDGREAFVE